MAHRPRPSSLLALVATAAVGLALVPSIASAQTQDPIAAPRLIPPSPVSLLGYSLMAAGYIAVLPPTFMAATSEAGLLPVFGGYIGGAMTLAHAGESGVSEGEATQLRTLGYVQIAASAVQTLGVLFVGIGYALDRAAARRAGMPVSVSSNSSVVRHRSAVRWMFAPTASPDGVGATVLIQAF